MKIAIVLALLVAAAYAFPGQEDIIAAVNSNPEATWTAGVNENFAGAGVAEVKRMLGWKPNPAAKPAMKEGAAVADAPATYSVVEAYKNYTVIQQVRNQGECGSCWAYGAVETMEDRFAIASHGKVDMLMSTQELTSCGPCSGCEGGDAGAAQMFLHEHGIVSESAYPYEEPTCQPSQQPCEPPFAPTKPCKTITNSTVYHCGSPYSVGGMFSSEKVKNIRAEIYAHGTVEACFTVYSDFIHYKSGIYRHTTGSALGGHCISLVGYGSQGGTDYWLARNSWTTSWGMDGFFMIATDTCGISDDVVACEPML